MLFKARIKPRVGLLALLLLLPVSAAQALHFGKLEMLSSPGQPLRARVPVFLLANDDPQSVQVSVLDQEAYEMQGMSRTGLPQSLELNLDFNAPSPMLRIHSNEVLGEGRPILLVHVSWNLGALQQRFLLGTDKAAVSQQKQVAKPAGKTFRSTEQQQLVASSTAGSKTMEQGMPVATSGDYARTYGPVGNETLDRIAVKLTENRPKGYLHMMYALFEANPKAFYRNNMNNLRAGVTLQVPSDEALLRLDNQRVFDTIKEHYQRWKADRDKNKGAGTEAGAIIEAMGDADVASIDFEATPEQLRKHLQDINAGTEQLREQNEQLQARLKQMEQRMGSLVERILAMQEPEAESPQPPQATAPLPEAAATSQNQVAVDPVNEEPLQESGKAWFIWMFLFLTTMGLLLGSRTRKVWKQA